MHAYGFIETRGTLAAIESLDTMLKSADVKLVTKELVGGGIVTVIVQGDVAAVKAAVEAGAARVRLLNEQALLTCHVIPRSDEQVAKLFQKDEIEEVVEENEIIENENEIIEVEKEIIQDEIIEEIAETVEEVVEVEEIVEVEEVKEEPEEIEITEEVETTETIEKVELPIKINKKKKIEAKEDLDNLVNEKGLEVAMKELGKLRVVELRSLVKKFKDLVMKKKSILKANKKTLLQEFANYYREEHK